METSFEDWLRQSLPWILLGALAWAMALRIARRRRLAERFERARRGERDAVAVLARAGFRVRDAQVTRCLEMLVDGRARPYDVRADFLVSDMWGRRYVAEVKTGGRAPDPLHAPTRRQLLEYQVGYPEARAVLLVDMETCQVHRIRFPM